jgi:mannitol-1-phosphate 5-dehydrogenase
MYQRVAIIGAGKTGRGFIARLAVDAGNTLVFIDHDTMLVERLASKGSYTIRFFGGRRPVLEISGYEAHHTSSPSAAEALEKADLIFVSVGASNFPEVASLLSHVAERRLLAESGIPLTVILCENAVDPAVKMRKLVMSSVHESLRSRLDQRLKIAESAIFCSTIEDGKDSPDIVSEDFNSLPYDATAAGRNFPNLPGLEPIADFGTFLKRKVYTYNCASAAIAYLGAFKGYSAYSEAANDPYILPLLSVLYDEIGKTLCAEFGFDPEDQRRFSARSLAKFRDPEIADSIERNARDVLRKLLPDERLAGPAALMVKHGIVPVALPWVFAAAMLYDQPSETSLRTLIAAKGPQGILREVSGIDPASELGLKIVDCYSALSTQKEHGGIPLAAIMPEEVQ